MSLPGGGPAKTGLHGEGVEHLVVPEYDSSPCWLLALLDVELGLGEGKQVGALKHNRTPGMNKHLSSKCCFSYGLGNFARPIKQFFSGAQDIAKKNKVSFIQTFKMTLEK